MAPSLENKVGATSVSKYDYLVNNLGQRSQREQSGTAFSVTNTDVFGYNEKGEVTGSTNAVFTTRNTSFAYDDIGNRTSVTDGSGTTGYTASTLNQYTLVGSAVPAFDADGNQTDTGIGQVYTWDGENRLVSVEPLVPAAGDKKILNAYDGQSRRVRKQVYTYSGSSWGIASDEKYLYDGWNLAAVYDAASSNALLRTYTWGTDLSGSLQGAGGVGGLLSVKHGGSVYHYTYDANGNVSEVLDSSGGIAAHYEYDAFGNTVVSSGTYAATNAYRFSTKLLDSESGLYYYGLRYYNPSTGRWLSKDPITEQGGINLYAMVGNDLVTHWDFLGLDPVGEWISGKYWRRWWFQTALWANDPTEVYEDGVGNTMASITTGLMDIYYTNLARAEVRSGQRNYACWTTVDLPTGNTNRPWTVVHDGIDFSDARFWLGSSMRVESAGGSFEFKYVNRTVYLRNTQGLFRWYDRIDSNPSKNDSWYKQTLETINQAAEALTGAPFNVNIGWGDDRSEEREGR